MTVSNKNQNEMTTEELIAVHNSLLEEQNELLRYYIENCAIHNFNKGNMRRQWQDSPVMYIQNICVCIFLIVVVIKVILAILGIWPF